MKGRLALHSHPGKKPTRGVCGISGYGSFLPLYQSPSALSLPAIARCPIYRRLRILPSFTRHLPRHRVRIRSTSILVTEHCPRRPHIIPARRNYLRRIIYIARGRVGVCLLSEGCPRRTHHQQYKCNHSHIHNLCPFSLCVNSLPTLFLRNPHNSHNSPKTHT